MDLRNGLTNISIVTHRDSDRLVRARFRGEQPAIEVEGRSVSIQSRRGPITMVREAMGRRRKPTGEISLRGGIGWHIDIAAGVTDILADFRDIELLGLDVAAGVRRMDVTLPRPAGRVCLEFSSGVTDVKLHRPAGVPLTILATSGVVGLEADGHHFPPIGSEMRWTSPDFSNDAGHYDLRVTSGVARLTVDSYA